MPDPENHGRLRRFLLFLVGVALLPAICAAALAVYDLFPALLTSTMPFIAPEPLAFVAGYALWTVLFLFLPPAIKMYVWGHELTHALWGLMTGSKVGKIKVGENGGYVNLTNPGIFTTLAPYFVPFYLVVVLLLRLVAGLFWDMEPYALWWLGLFGMAYGFHVTYTVRSLTERQPDIKEFGHVISYVLILLINVLVFGYGIVAVTNASIPQYHGALFERGAQAYSFVGAQIMRAFHALMEAVAK
jgi:hypothetical protein